MYLLTIYGNSDFKSHATTLHKHSLPQTHCTTPIDEFSVPCVGFVATVYNHYTHSSTSVFIVVDMGWEHAAVPFALRFHRSYLPCTFVLSAAPQDLQQFQITIYCWRRADIARTRPFRTNYPSTRNWLEWACPIYNNLLPGVRLRISPPDLHPRSCSTRNSAYDWLEGSQLLDRTNLTDMQISWHMIHLRDPDSLSIGDCRYLLLVQYRVWGMMSLLVHVTSSVSVEV